MVHTTKLLALAALLVGCQGVFSVDGNAPSPDAEESGERANDTPAEVENPDPAPATPNEEFECIDDSGDPGPAPLRRLTVEEYVETVRVVFGVDVAEEAADALPADVRTDGFTNTAYNLAVGYEHVVAFVGLARSIVQQVDVEAFAAESVECSDPSAACFEEGVRAMGLRVLRAPLPDEEIASFLEIRDAVVAEEGDYGEAVAYVLEAMLQSPRFLYRIETEVGDDGVVEVDGWSMASRLSYLVWGGPPDAELLRAAEAGELATTVEIRTQVERMLADPRAREASKRFVRDWLSLERLDNISRDPEHFPEWNDQIAQDMRLETLAYFESVVWDQGLPMVRLYDAQETWATGRLASFYGIESQGEGLQLYDTSSVAERGGILTQGSLLTIGGDEASMVTRGLFVLIDLMCGAIEDPPPGTDTTPVPPEPGRSNRQIAEDRLANAGCGGCHSQFEPFAFGLEPFDATGGYRDVDGHGNEMRQDGKILIPGDEGQHTYATIAELSSIVAGTDRARQCMELKLAQYALGRPILETDACMLAEMDEKIVEGGGTYAAMIEAIATSELMRTRRTDTP